MPGIRSKLHLRMFDVRRDEGVYGLEWGDPDTDPQLKVVRDEFLLPRIKPDATVLDIGPGGGRWTRYMLDAGRVIVVDPFEEILENHAEALPDPKIERVLNAGDDFPGIADGAVDFAFCFGVFVHLERAVIEAYLTELHRVLSEDAVAIVQFSDKTKPSAARNLGFSANSPRKMRRSIAEAGHTVLWENNTLLWHSSIFAFRKARAGETAYPTGVLPELPDALYPRVS